MVFQWKEGTRHKVDPNIAGAMCSDMEKAGKLTAENLVEANRPKNAPLHAEFDWNNTVAAEKWRCHQARNIINSIVLVGEDQPKVEAVRCFFRVESAAPNYESVNTIIRNEDKYAKLVEQALRELVVFKKKYAQIKELSAVFNAIEELEGKNGKN